MEDYIYNTEKASKYIKIYFDLFVAIIISLFFLCWFVKVENSILLEECKIVLKTGQVTYYSNTDAEVLDVLVQKGDQIKRGDRLAELVISNKDMVQSDEPAPAKILKKENSLPPGIQSNIETVFGAVAYLDLVHIDQVFMGQRVRLNSIDSTNSFLQGSIHEIVQLPDEHEFKLNIHIEDHPSIKLIHGQEMEGRIFTNEIRLYQYFFQKLFKVAS